MTPVETRSPPPPSTTRHVGISLLGGIYFAAMLFVAIPLGLLFLTGHPITFRIDLLRLAGLLLIVLGNVVVVALIVRFVREGRGSHVPLDPPTRFVHGGLFRRTRNPMYLTYVVIIAGEALFFASWILAAYATLFWLVFHLYVVYREEPALHRRFGPAYAEYCETVPRWLPRLRLRP